VFTHLIARWADRAVHRGPILAHAQRVSTPGFEAPGGTAAAVAPLIERIGLVFQRAHLSGAERPGYAEVEALLAEGYAEALSLELDQARTERRIADLFAAGSKGPNGSPAAELRALGATRLARERDIARVRSLLEELREYGETLKP
jgi:hypothetical protein